ncbi:FAD dependent oxidoreductase [Podospora appendiculata]|uniref:FAD dependent oxidoreductase n=1 Tax=Podospora appendiculata TaxID=314037 RepID=A0AAE0XL03_9PEZI|nr:FAD dependent oxidoreductase [Podospora appendiculata]
MDTTVIFGAGIIGLSAAYYLSDHQPPSSIHLVEPAPQLFSSASGYAGGFLAKDWHSPASAPLGVLSFDEHRRLSEKHGGREKWGYSPTTSIGYAASEQFRTSKRGDDWLREGTSRAGTAPVSEVPGGEKVPTWLKRVPGDHVEVISEDGSTAQVDPLLLCRFLLQECLKRGVKLHHPAEGVSVDVDVRGELASVSIVNTLTSTETDLPCTKVIIAAGAWSGRVFRQLFRHSKLELPIGCLAGHSIVVAARGWSEAVEAGGCHALYASHAGGGYAPEIFARVGGRIYVAGLNHPGMVLPEQAGGAPVQSEAVEVLRATARELLEGEDMEIVREGLCFRPVTPWGRPVIARVQDGDLGVGMATREGAEGGVYVAAGHGPWGISLALGTGIVVAEMVQGRPLSADVRLLGLR